MRSNHNPYIAPIPILTDRDVQRQYPSTLQLKLVQIVHRHGERTPIASGLTHLVDPHLHQCQVGSFLNMQSHLSSSNINPMDAHAPKYQKVLHSIQNWEEKEGKRLHASPGTW
jgi:hypothetical protein